MLAFKGEDAQTVKQLDFDMADGKFSLCAPKICHQGSKVMPLSAVTGHAVLSRVVRRVSGDYVSLCFHSTPEFATKYEYVYGSTSAAAKLAADKWASDDNKKKEQQVNTGLTDGSLRFRALGLGLKV